MHALHALDLHMHPALECWALFSLTAIPNAMHHNSHQDIIPDEKPAEGSHDACTMSSQAAPSLMHAAEDT